MTARLERVSCTLTEHELKTGMVRALRSMVQQRRSPGQPAARRNRIAEPDLILMGNPKSHMCRRQLIPATVVTGVGMSPLGDCRSGSFDPPQGSGQAIASDRRVICGDGGFEGSAGRRPVTRGKRRSPRRKRIRSQIGHA